MYGFKILCEISKVPFEISHKILNPYTAKYAFYWLLFFFVIYDILELWRHKPQCWSVYYPGTPCPWSTMKSEGRKDANFVVTGSTGGCHNDNLRCHQWRQSWHLDNSQFSVMLMQFTRRMGSGGCYLVTNNSQMSCRYFKKITWWGTGTFISAKDDMPVMGNISWPHFIF